MADIDFITSYMPDYAELEQTVVYDTRTRLVNYIQVKFDDVDLTPNTVVGDLIVSPQAFTMASIEEGLSRFMSDLNLGNLAANTIFNCDFARTWISNFVNADTLSLRASGVARLTFDKNANVVLDRGTQFRFNNDNIFTIYLPGNGPFYIYPVGAELPPGVNGTTLHDSGSGTFFCDVPLVGETGSILEATEENIRTGEEPTIIAGSSGEITFLPEGLTDIAALTDFDPGYAVFTIAQLAKQAQTTVYSASLNTRTGAIRYVQEICPFAESVSALHNGDREMLRAFHNPYGAASGCMDVYVRTKSYEFTEVQNVRLTLNADETAFEGDWDYVGQPYHIESITHANTPTVANIPNIIITSTNDKGLGALAAYTVHEKLHISIPNILDENGDSIYNPQPDINGVMSSTFIITYQTDPMFRAVQQALTNNDNIAINTDVLVKGFTPVIIRSFEVEYVRDAGVIPTLVEAQDQIKAYLGGVGYPDAYSDAVIAKIMGEAGVKYVKRINVAANVQWSVANKIADFSGTITDVPTTPAIISSSGLRISYPGESVSLNASDMYACSPRTIRYYLLEGSVTFKEVKDI